MTPVKAPTPKCPACARDMARTFGDKGWIGWKCMACPNVSIVEGRKP